MLHPLSPSPGNRLDRLAALALTRLEADSTDSGAADATPIDRLRAARSAVEHNGGMGRTYKHEAAVQHLTAAVWEYVRLLAPRRGWRLAATQSGCGDLVWCPEDPQLPLVIDVLRSRGFVSPDDSLRHPDAVVRVCDLSGRRQSFLTFPRETQPVMWCPADDPILSRELAVLS